MIYGNSNNYVICRDVGPDFDLRSCGHVKDDHILSIACFFLEMPVPPIITFPHTCSNRFLRDMVVLGRYASKKIALQSLVDVIVRVIGYEEYLVNMATAQRSKGGLSQML